jgi:hypothetical protein
VFDLWPLWIYAALGVIFFVCEPIGFYRTLFVSFFPLHPFACTFSRDFGQMVFSDAARLLSGFPWISFISLKNIFGGKDE